MTFRGLARSRALILVVLAAVSLAFAPRAHADTAPTPYIPWSSVLPGWNDQYAPGSDNFCAAGRSQCLGHTIQELLHIFTPNAQSCSHLALFPLAYLRMTQTYGWTRTQPGYYDDVAYMNHMDAVFAKYYTDAYYNWSGHNRAAVPQSWLYAFDAAQNKSVSGVGDLLLGMNAHINRDLPFVLYASGLVETDGGSGKSDFDAVEKWLNDDTAPLFAEAAHASTPRSTPRATPSSTHSRSRWCRPGARTHGATRRHWRVPPTPTRVRRWPPTSRTTPTGWDRRCCVHSPIAR